MSARYLLAADVGGTRTTMAIGTAAIGKVSPAPSILLHRIYPSQEFSGLEPIVSDFLAQPGVISHGGKISAACFSVAGPVAGNAATLTNLGWKVDGAGLSKSLHLPVVTLINDFAAAGQGVSLLPAAELETLQAGKPVERATRLIVGAGTGLGVGLLTWQDGGYIVHPSEAGHADFAPVDEIQDKLLVHLRRTFGRVSYERIVSGPGLMRIFHFLQDAGFGVPSRQFADASRNCDDIAGLVAEFALGKLDPLAVRALDLFIAVYGAFVGNIALAVLAHGGVYIAGGIAPKIVSGLRDEAFVRAFGSKGRFSDLLAGMPVHVVKNPQVGLLGALLEAARLTNRA